LPVSFFQEAGLSEKSSNSFQVNPTFKITFERTINAPIQKVWEAWSDPTTWSKWAFQNITSDFKVGGKFDNGKGEGGEYIIIEPLKLIRFTWDINHYEPGSFIQIIFISKGEKETLCRLEHNELKRQSDKLDSEIGWNWGMDSLKSFLETGKGLTWDDWQTLPGI
jgi:uncharacterized protein YndB with AHSA1/START domain